MAIILASSFNMTEKDANGVRYAVPVAGVWRETIEKFTPGRKSVVIVANDPENFEVNDMWANALFESLEKSGFCFENRTLIDNRSLKDAKNIIQNADLVMLSGGKIKCQQEFFARLGMGDLVKNHRGLVMGGSAGAMNLCDRVFNFPEDLAEIDDRTEDEYFVRGLGFYDRIIIPHCDGHSKIYARGEAEVEVFRDYLVPMSRGREFICFDDDAFIVLDGEKVEYFGDFYTIKDGTVRKFRPPAAKVAPEKPLRYKIRIASVVYLIKNDDDGTKVLLQKRGNGTFGAGYWDGSFAGHVDTGESMLECAVREAKEELGITFDPKDVVFTTFIHLSGSPNPPDTEPYINGHFFVSKCKGSPKICEPDKCSEIKWFDVKNLPAEMFSDRREAIKNFQNNKNYSEIW